MTETLATLKAEIDAFSKAVSNQNLGMGQQTSATKSIPDLFRDADGIVYEDMNGLMGHVEDDYPGLFAEFNEVKKIKDPSAGSGHAWASGTIRPRRRHRIRQTRRSTIGPETWTRYRVC